jgi:hypothetical protein
MEDFIMNIIKIKTRFRRTVLQIWRY